MKNSLLVSLLFLFLLPLVKAQESYFPGNDFEDWETVDPSTLGWCTDEIPPLINFLEEKNTKGFMILHKGKIVMEHYVDSFTADSLWYWASAGKTLAAFQIGRAAQQGFLDINDPTSNYLGTGWTSASPDKEVLITIKDQMKMTTGLDEGISLTQNCVAPDCLNYLVDPDSRWYYYNAPYRLLHEVLESATGLSYNLYTNSLENAIGIEGISLNYIYYSRLRDFARFGLLMLNEGNWDGNAILDNPTFFNEMVNTSQEFNSSYGYLTWLNGKANFMLPGTSLVFDGPLIPAAPADLYAALGKNDQKLHIVPSMDLVVVRMGNPSGISLFAASPFDNELWTYLNSILCTTSTINETTEEEINVYPNPIGDRLMIHSNRSDLEIKVIDVLGKTILSTTSSHQPLNSQSWLPGIYYIQFFDEKGDLVKMKKVVKL